MRRKFVTVLAVALALSIQPTSVLAQGANEPEVQALRQEVQILRQEIESLKAAQNHGLSSMLDPASRVLIFAGGIGVTTSIVTVYARSVGPRGVPVDAAEALTKFVVRVGVGGYIALAAGIFLYLISPAQSATVSDFYMTVGGFHALMNMPTDEIVRSAEMFPQVKYLIDAVSRQQAAQ
jgi:hypothetical protein